VCSKVSADLVLILVCMSTKWFEIRSNGISVRFSMVDQSIMETWFMVTAFVVQGSGVSPLGSQALSDAYKKHGADSVLADITLIERHLGRLEASQLSQSVLVCGGGSSFEMAKHLVVNKARKKRLQHCVDQGLNYASYCGGANIATSGTRYRSFSGVPLDIPTLNLLPVKATGPALDRFIGKEMRVEDAELVKVKLTDGSVLKAYSCHGPAFINSSVPSEGVVARFNTLPVPSMGSVAAGGADAPAIVQGYYGQGKVMLSAVHPEIELNNESDTDTQERELLMEHLVNLSSTSATAQQQAKGVSTESVIDLMKVNGSSYRTQAKYWPPE